MGLAGAGGGAVAGIVVGSWGYAWLAGASAIVGVVILLAGFVRPRHPWP
jgi:hypothetical protein